MALRCYGKKVLGQYGVVVRGIIVYGVTVTWCNNVMASYGEMMLHYNDVMILRYNGVTILWCYDVTMIWCHGVMS